MKSANLMLLKRAVDAAQPQSKPYTIWDTGVKGFGLWVSPTGVKSYVLQYRPSIPGMAEKTPPKRFTIGRHGDWTPDQARKRARELRAMVDRGDDPMQAKHDAITQSKAAQKAAAEKARLENELAFTTYAERFLSEYDKRPNTVAQARSVIRNHMSPVLKDKPMPHITKADVARVIARIPAKQKAARHQTYQYLSILFGWALAHDDINVNPVATMKSPAKPASKDRVLTDAELETVWQASVTLAAPFGEFIRLLILTGQRREEVAAMDWSEVDRETWTIPKERAKNGKVHIVPLSASAVAELDALAKGDWPKSGPVLKTSKGVALCSFSRVKRLLDAAITKLLDGEEMEGWTVHDLRRTLATGMQRLGIRMEVVEAILNHVSGSRAGVAGIYQRHDWADEKRAALEAWAAHVAALIEPADKASNVVPISKKSA